jgi:DNA-binding LacI/PurR family transcriptional regulator
MLEEVSLAGSGDVTKVSLTEPTITAVAQPACELRAGADRTVLEMVEQDRQPDSIIFRGKADRVGLVRQTQGGR